jgi:hypothetical protein
VEREQLAHVLRAACAVAMMDRALVIGSQAILASFPDLVLPEAAVRSVEVDVAFFDDADNERSDLVEGAIGELSQFHLTYGYYAQGVSVTTAVLPEGWADRLVTFADLGRCLEPHDLVASKLVAYREKDQEFGAALLQAGLVDAAILRERIDVLPVDDARRKLLTELVDAVMRYRR